MSRRRTPDNLPQHLRMTAEEYCNKRADVTANTVLFYFPNGRMLSIYKGEFMTESEYQEKFPFMKTERTFTPEQVAKGENPNKKGLQ